MKKKTIFLILVIVSVLISAVLNMPADDRVKIPAELMELYARNPETEEFVFGFGKALPDNTGLSDEEISVSCVPHFLQWDRRWGYEKYSEEYFALSGCGPTALSMVMVYLTGDGKYDPGYIGKFATENDFSTYGDGSKWTLMSDGAKMLGINSEEVMLNERYIEENLKNGNPIIAIMAKGDFTTTGHFIVFTDYIDGKIKVNDPNSISRSEKLWEYDRIADQIRNLWVFTKHPQQ
ncbi:MAG: C39 family peptidase [Eubacteriaceae bacterium]|nr:C39 family peptidase [Eubacteriaceae bacterium]